MNKTLYTFIFILSIGLSSVFGQNKEYTIDTMSMSPGYTNDIFYSMSNGEVANVPRAGWDIAFYTNTMSAGIIINEGNGVELYSYPKGDTTAWANIDTVGLSTWTPLYNSPEYWEDGAFNRNATGHPDYGWGIYNMVTHSVIGDSIYIIKDEAGIYKKLWIVKKVSVENMYHIRYADIDGTNEMEKQIDAKLFLSKNFIYFSLSTGAEVDREPNTEWDILFTKYIDLTETMSGEMTEYLVTGATSNVNHRANKYYPVPEDFEGWGSKPLDSLKNTIGYNWKSFDMSTFQWIVEDSTVFFVKSGEGDIYKLVFTYWQGASTGVFAINKKLVSIVGVGELNETGGTLSVYPNPASKMLNIKTNYDESFIGNVVITDISGRQVYGSSFVKESSINVGELTQGIYFVTIYNDSYKHTQKLIIK